MRGGTNHLEECRRAFSGRFQRHTNALARNREWNRENAAAMARNAIAARVQVIDVEE
jgi:hypothetical protein